MSLAFFLLLDKRNCLSAWFIEWAAGSAIHYEDASLFRAGRLHSIVCCLESLYIPLSGHAHFLKAISIGRTGCSHRGGV